MPVHSDVLIVPGLGSSGRSHWQTLWQEAHGYERVEQRDWDAPSRAEWLETLERALRARTRPSVLVAHSLGCALIAHYSLQPSAAKLVRAALLVAPADVDDPARTPECTRCFAPLPLRQLPFESLVVASADDPFCGPSRARQFAEAWGADFEDIGNAGHINADSGLGAWPAGHRFLQRVLV
ncbi:MAG TPA: alpha/beta fold hydrolase [Polyangiales bacterium]|nr:alpha/beta fold hydrolase [Polyangiales bacterium]